MAPRGAEETRRRGRARRVQQRARLMGRREAAAAPHGSEQQSGGAAVSRCSFVADLYSNLVSALACVRCLHAHMCLPAIVSVKQSWSCMQHRSQPCRTQLGTSHPKCPQVKGQRNGSELEGRCE